MPTVPCMVFVAIVVAARASSSADRLFIASPPGPLGAVATLLSMDAMSPLPTLSQSRLPMRCCNRIIWSMSSRVWSEWVVWRGRMDVGRSEGAVVSVALLSAWLDDTPAR